MHHGSYAGLQEAVSHARYKGWGFRLIPGVTFAFGLCSPPPGPPATTATSGTVILTAPLILMICAAVEDSGGGGPVTVEHPFYVPPEGTCPSWPRWLLDRVLDVERHETCEVFEIGGRRLFYPEHGASADLYAITERPGCMAP